MILVLVIQLQTVGSLIVVTAVPTHGDCVGEDSSCTQWDCDNCAAYNGFLDPETCYCWSATPITIDTQGNGFDLTDAAEGVTFDF